MWNVLLLCGRRSSQCSSRHVVAVILFAVYFMFSFGTTEVRALEPVWNMPTNAWDSYPVEVMQPINDETVLKQMKDEEKALGKVQMRTMFRVPPYVSPTAHALEDMVAESQSFDEIYNPNLLSAQGSPNLPPAAMVMGDHIVPQQMQQRLRAPTLEQSLRYEVADHPPLVDSLQSHGEVMSVLA